MVIIKRIDSSELVAIAEYVLKVINEAAYAKYSAEVANTFMNGAEEGIMALMEQIMSQEEKNEVPEV